MTRASAEVERPAVDGRMLLADRPHQRFRGQKRRVGEAMEKVRALGVTTQKRQRVAIRRGVLCHEQAKVFLAHRIVSKTQEAVECFVAPPRLEGV